MTTQPITLTDMQNELLYGELVSILGEENVVCTSRQDKNDDLIYCYCVNLSRAGGWVDPLLTRFHQRDISLKELLNAMNGPLADKPFHYRVSVNTFIKNALVVDYSEKDNKALIEHLATIPSARAPEKPRYKPAQSEPGVDITR
jgi:hypothetical protein